MKKTRIRSVFAITLAIVVWAVAVHQGRAATIYGVAMGDPGVSGDGSVVVGSGGGLWTQATGLVHIGGIPNYGPTYLIDASFDGSIVVGHGGNAPSLAFSWTSSKGFATLGFLPGFSVSVAHGVSADGSVVAGYAESSIKIFRQAVLWNNGQGPVALGFLPGATYSDARDVSADGTIVVGTSSISGTAGVEAVRWVNGGPAQGLGFAPGDVGSKAYGISADGKVIVGVTSNGNGGSAMRWTASGGMAALTSLSSEAFATTQDGSIIVGDIGPGPQSQAFIWDAAHGVRDLKVVLSNEFGLGGALANWTLSQATGISANGKTIVGNGFFNHQQATWIVQIPEPPSSVLAMTSVLVCLPTIVSFLRRSCRRTKRGTDLRHRQRA